MYSFCKREKVQAKIVTIPQTLSKKHGKGICATANNNLSLGYKGKAVMKNIGFTLYHHEIIAISGAFGAGKFAVLKYFISHFI